MATGSDRYYVEPLDDRYWAVYDSHDPLEDRRPVVHFGTRVQAERYAKNYNERLMATDSVVRGDPTTPQEATLQVLHVPCPVCFVSRGRYCNRPGSGWVFHEERVIAARGRLDRIPHLLLEAGITVVDTDGLISASYRQATPPTSPPSVEGKKNPHPDPANDLDEITQELHSISVYLARTGQTGASTVIKAVTDILDYVRYTIQDTPSPSSPTTTNPA